MRLRNENGFLFIEALMAIIIISTALVAMITMFFYAMRTNYKAGTYTAAANLAQEYMEQVKAGYPGQLPPVSDQITMNGVTYTRTYALPSRTDIDARGILKELTVTVAWGTDEKISLQTFIVGNDQLRIHP